MYKCFHCGGNGWVANGNIMDGMMTGRDACPVCEGKGSVTAEQIMHAIVDIIARATS